MAQQIMGNRILGGIGAPDSRAGASFGAGVDTALSQRTSRQQMQEREQMMGLRASQEQRAQQQFEMQQRQAELQQRQAAAAAARAAQQRAALQAYTAGLQIPGAAPAGVTAPAGGTSAPAIRPPPAQLSPFPPAGAAPMTYGTTPGLNIENAEFLSGTLPAGVDPRGRMQLPGGAGSTRVAGGAGTDVLAQPAAQDMGGGFTDPTQVTQGELPGFVQRLMQVPTAPATVGGYEATYPEEVPAAEIPAVTEEPEPQAKDTPWGGPQLDFGTPVQLTFGQEKGRGSDAFVRAPEKIFAQYDKIQQDRADLVRAAEYYRVIGDAGSLATTAKEIRQLDLDSQYLDGMLAIVGIQQGNFGPLQELMTARYPGRQVELRPYTDETVEIFLDGQSEARLDWGDLAQDLREDYDKNYIDAMQAAATEVASRSRFEFEERVKAEEAALRDIAIAEAQRMLDEGELRPVDPTADLPLYEMIVGGKLTTVTVSVSEDGTTISLIPIDTSALR